MLCVLLRVLSSRCPANHLSTKRKILLLLPADSIFTLKESINCFLIRAVMNRSLRVGSLVNKLMYALTAVGAYSVVMQIQLNIS